MRPVTILELLYSFFMGVMFAVVVWSAWLFIYARPDWGNEAATKTWNTTTAIVLVIVATIALVCSLILGNRVIVIANALLLGGVITMISGVVMAFNNDSAGLRFAVMAAALAVTVAVGYRKFKPQPKATQAAGGPEFSSDDLDQRLRLVEAKLAAITTALTKH